MKIAYFDCFSGASGDMILGALLDAGLPLAHLQQGLASLGLPHVAIDAVRVVKKGLSGTQALVCTGHGHHHEEHRHQDDHHHHGENHRQEGHHHHGENHRQDDHHHHGEHKHGHEHHRGLSDIRAIIEGSGLPEAVQQNSIRIFTRLAHAEAKVHHVDPESIHFHEVGALDAIVDVVGSVIGIEALGIERIVCSPLHLGTGTIECAHGTLPVPAPATAELILGKPAYATGVQGELLTPTGAAILTTLASDFGPMPAMQIEAVGYGAGTAERDLPNMLRLILGRRSPSDAAAPMPHHHD